MALDQRNSILSSYVHRVVDVGMLSRLLWMWPVLFWESAVLTDNADSPR